MANVWAPEPLTHDGVWFVDANGHQLGGPQAWELDEATINRMLAAYNACAGVPTEKLHLIQSIMTNPILKITIKPQEAADGQSDDKP